MKKEFTKKNKSPGGEQTIYYIVNDISIDDLKTCINEVYFKNLCKTGCVNYGKKWSCPPYSPMMSKLIVDQEYKRMILICGYIYLKDMDYIKNPYQKVKAANIILKSKCEKAAREIEEITKGYALLSGSCNLCKPCCKKQGLPCKKPDRIRYSLESTGVNVEKLVKNYCDHQLCWYKRGCQQEYTSAVTAVLTNKNHIMDFGTLLFDHCF